eukprot:4089748-Alexandrium_andersonii.AAC.1
MLHPPGGNQPRPRHIVRAMLSRLAPRASALTSVRASMHARMQVYPCMDSAHGHEDERMCARMRGCGE